MEWQDKGFVLAARRHGETSLIVDVLTAQHGRHAGYVRGGAASKRLRGILTRGNLVDLVWKARLAEHLGALRVELNIAHTAHLMDDALALDALNALCALAAILPERAPAPMIFDLFGELLAALLRHDLWPILLARFELVLLAELGFGLDLTQARSAHDKKIFISASGEVVKENMTQEAAKAKGLTLLPRFLVEDLSPTHQEIIEALRLTMWFLQQRVYEPRGQNLPEARRQLIKKLKKLNS